MREAISQALWEEMERDPAVFILGEEVGVWGGTYAVTKGFFDHFGAERVRDTPIAENAILGAAIGAALVGQRPIAELMTINFAFSAMDYVVNQAPKLHYMFGGQFMLPMVIRAVGGDGAGVGRQSARLPDGPADGLARKDAGPARLPKGGGLRNPHRARPWGRAGHPRLPSSAGIALLDHPEGRADARWCALGITKTRPDRCVTGISRWRIISNRGATRAPATARSCRFNR